MDSKTLLHLLVRQDDGAGGQGNGPVQCDGENGFDGNLGIRISAIFVILVGSFFGAVFPVFARRGHGFRVPEWSFFCAKFFGSGVIIATAFIHLLAPAGDALRQECLGEIFKIYPWVEGIALMTIMVMFVVELMVMRYGDFGGSHAHDHSHGEDRTISVTPENGKVVDGSEDYQLSSQGNGPTVPGTDHLGHLRTHRSNEDVRGDWEERGIIPESYAAQMTAIFILEFGVIFHSIFVGLTLAVAGDEFKTLYVVLVFHQTFEGLGLGSRLSSIPWPKSKRWTPYALGLGYALSTPIAIAIGLGVRYSYAPGSPTAVIINGVFDSISAGILIYTGLVELMAHEFMFSPSMQKASIKTVLSALGMMWLGAGLMALLGRWA